MRFSSRIAVPATIVLAGLIASTRPGSDDAAPRTATSPSSAVAAGSGAEALLLTTAIVDPTFAQRPSPGFVYQQGAQGVGYYPAPPTRTVSNVPRNVGPSARNWSTGNRVPMHRPWMRARN
ncbi:MAG: hypothetical protein SFX72_17425 [Isosphaeraceae bacterium]|nr:hypothetical protein [Isosphaeraceae bacterium]